MVNLDDWVKVRDVSGELTWIEKKSLSERRTVIVTVASADVRQAADGQSAVVFKANEGVILELAEFGAQGPAPRRPERLHAQQPGLGAVARAPGQAPAGTIRA